MCAGCGTATGLPTTPRTLLCKPQALRPYVAFCYPSISLLPVPTSLVQAAACSMEQHPLSHAMLADWTDWGDMQGRL